MFEILAPIFALVALGYGCRRLRVLGPHAYVELNHFVVALALPALLFDIVAHVTLRQLDQPGFIASFGLGALLVLAVPLLVGRRGRPFGDAALDALTASYPNTGYIGLPLAVLAFGPASAPGAAIAVVFTTCVLFGIAIMLLELDAHRGDDVGSTVLKVARSLIRNPMIVAPICAIAFTAGWIPLPAAGDRLVKLLAGAAGPCALVSLGLFLASDDSTNARPWAAAFRARPLALVALKLVVQPFVTAALAVFAFGLAPRDVALVTILSALPTGTGAFMLAAYFNRDPEVTSAAILLSTLASVLTLSICLAVFPALS